jgi:hypothetical protein
VVTRPRPQAFPRADAFWWLARRSMPLQCRFCGALVQDRPAVMAYDPAQDPGGEQARLHPDWVRLGWTWWQECSACGRTYADQAVSADEIRRWRVGPWFRR